MIKSLNLAALEDALPRAGLNQSAVAMKLGVSREVVRKWFSGVSIPEPDKLLRLGMLLGLTFDELAITEVKSAVPIVAFRRKEQRIPRDSHLDAGSERASHFARWGDFSTSGNQERLKMANNSGRSLELYFIDGKPDGMLTAEVFNWSCSLG